MRKMVLKLALATSLVLAFGCSDDDDGGGPSKKITAYRVDGDERILIIEGIDAKYNNYYLAINLYPEGWGELIKENADEIDSKGTYGLTDVLGPIEKTCTAANTRLERVRNGQIRLSLVDNGSVLEDVRDEQNLNMAVFKPCKDGNYMIQMILTKNERDLDKNMADVEWCYTEDGSTVKNCQTMIAFDNLPLFVLSDDETTLNIDQFTASECPMPTSEAKMGEYFACMSGK